MKTTNEGGFAAVVLVLLIAGLLSVAVFAAYTVSKPSATPSPTPTASPAAVRYLDIKELGVKIQLSDPIKDLTYYYDATGTAAYLSSKQLAERSNGACAAGLGVGPLSTLNKSSAPPQGLDPTAVSKLNRIGGQYVYLTSPQAACSEDPSVTSLMSAQRGALLDAFTTIQAD